MCEPCEHCQECEGGLKEFKYNLFKCKRFILTIRDYLEKNGLILPNAPSNRGLISYLFCFYLTKK